MSLNLLYHGVGGDMVDVDDSHETNGDDDDSHETNGDVDDSHETNGDVDDSHETNGDDDEVHDEADGVVLMIMLSVDD